ncbi:MAG: hypothetical protein U0452_06945 [Anaerolineae bacterium]
MDLFDLYTAVMLGKVAWMFEGGADRAQPGLQFTPHELEQEIARLSGVELLGSGL